MLLLQCTACGHRWEWSLYLPCNLDQLNAAECQCPSCGNKDMKSILIVDSMKD